METILVIFGLGVVVSLVVAKGVMQAHDFANDELDKLDTPAQNKVVEK